MLLVIAVFAAVFWLPTPWGVAAIVGALIVEVAEAGFWVRLSRRRKPVIGAEAVVGALGVAVDELRPAGRVRVHGELWQARCPEGAAEGTEVFVERVEPDLTLLVTPTSP